MIRSRLCGATAFPADRAVGDADSRIEDAEIVVNFRHRPDRRAGIFAGRFLFDRNRRGDAARALQIGLGHFAELPPRKRRKGLDIAPLPLDVEGIEGQGGFPRAGDAGKDDEFVRVECQGRPTLDCGP